MIARAYYSGSESVNKPVNRPQDTILAKDAVFRRNSFFVINYHLVAVFI